MRQISVTALVLLMACCGCASSRAMQHASMPPRPARINHMVLFKLKNPADAAELIADCDRTLAPIPGIVAYSAGRHLDTGRANVESNYDVGLYIGFNNQSDYAAYVDHPNHLAGIEKWKPRWEWIRIYDVLDESP